MSFANDLASWASLISSCYSLVRSRNSVGVRPTNCFGDNTSPSHPLEFG